MGERFTVASTGTQLGMTLLQQRVVGRMLAKLLQRHRERLYVVHGDCVGSDAMCDALCAAYQIRRGIYPSDVESKRAHCERNGAEVLRSPSPPLDRNGWIVSSGDLLIVTPKSHEEELRSGTWATVRCARKLYRDRGGPQSTMFDEKKTGSIVIVWPNGAADFDFPECRPAMIGA